MCCVCVCVEGDERHEGVGVGDQPGMPIDRYASHKLLRPFGENDLFEVCLTLALRNTPFACVPRWTMAMAMAMAMVG